MEQRLAPPSLRNAVFEAIQAEGLDHKEFEWSTVKGPRAHFAVSRLTHRRTGFFILFDIGYEPEFYLECWPGGEFREVPPHAMAGLVAKWMHEIAPEIQAPDLWQLAAEQAAMGTNPAQHNTPFSADEQKRLGAGLRELEEFVYRSETSLDATKREAVAARFSYLRESLARLGRLDWTTLVVGQFFSMAVEKIITVQTFHALYNLAATVLAKALEVGAPIMHKLLGG